MPQEFITDIPQAPQVVKIEDIIYNKEQYIKEVAKSLFANASLNTMDDYGNLVPLPDAKVQVIARNCKKYAGYLADLFY